MRQSIEWRDIEEPENVLSRILIVVEAIEKIRDHFQHGFQQTNFILRQSTEDSKSLALHLLLLFLLVAESVLPCHIFLIPLTRRYVRFRVLLRVKAGARCRKGGSRSADRVASSMIFRLLYVAAAIAIPGSAPGPFSVVTLAHIVAIQVVVDVEKDEERGDGRRGEKPQRRLMGSVKSSIVARYLLSLIYIGVIRDATLRTLSNMSVGCSDSEQHDVVTGRKMLDDSESGPAAGSCHRMIGQVAAPNFGSCRSHPRCSRAQLIEKKNLHLFLLTSHLFSRFSPLFVLFR